MKPTKNRIFCPDCTRPKLLFKTEKQANNFIRFNAEEIAEENGYAPVRSYYCPLCGGWHVTSNPDAEHFEGRTTRMQRFVYDQIDNKHGKTSRTGRISAAKEAFENGELLESAKIYVANYRSCKAKKTNIYLTGEERRELDDEMLTSFSEALSILEIRIASLGHADEDIAACRKLCNSCVKIAMKDDKMNRSMAIRLSRTLDKMSA